MPRSHRCQADRPYRSTQTLLLEPLESRLLLNGLTIITHGYLASAGRPGWLDGMASAIINRAGPDTAVYDLVVQPNGANVPVVTGFARISGPPMASSTNGQTILLLDWSAASDVLNNFISTADIANAVTPYLLTANPAIGLTAPLAQGAIHLIGHSRGASLISEIAKDLGAAGIWVDQLTTLDPRPVNSDPSVSLGSNTVFADNYYEYANLFPIGQPVSGAVNVGPLSLGGEYPFLDGGQHSDVHLFYQGTIDTSATASDGTYGVPAAWYPANSLNRATTGFYYTLIAGGTRPASGVSSAFGGSAARSPITHSGAQWPDLETVMHGLSIIGLGQSFSVSYRYQDIDTAATVQWYLDADQNPYDANSTAIGSAIALGSTGDTVASASANLAASGVAPGTYYVFGRITDGTFTRYMYATTPITVIGGPIGAVDLANTAKISGWAYSPAAGSAAANVRITVDGGALATFAANQARVDLTAAVGSTNHGFSFALPNLGAGVHIFRVYAVDPTTAAATLIGTASISIPSALFDESWYLAKYPDVAAAVAAGGYASGWQHFVLHGQNEGRDPSEFFSQRMYLALNPDVAAAVRAGGFASGYQHYMLLGAHEGRAVTPFFSEAFYLSKYPDVAAAVRAGGFASGYIHFVAYGQAEGRRAAPYFDAAYYATVVPALAAALTAGTYRSAFDQFLRVGNALGYSPLDLFNPTYYLATYPAVATAISAGTYTSAFDEFMRRGRLLGNRPSTLYNEAAYLAKNPDVAAAVRRGAFDCGLTHYLLFGRAEGRVCT